MISRVFSILSEVPPRAWIWISILIAAASNSVVVKIQQLGACHPNSHGVNPISYCNLLFAGSVVAFTTLLLLRPKQIKTVTLRVFSFREWVVTIIAASLAGGVAPILLFEALSKASVTGVVLVQTIEIPLVLLFAWILYGERSGWLAVVGGMIAFSGVFLTAWYGNGGEVAFGHGEVLAILGTVAAVLSTQLSRRVMERMSPVLFGIVRNFLGIFLFAAIVLWFFGLGHFTDIFSPYLWAWTLVYGSLIVVAGQLTWFKGISSVTAAEIALAAAFTPVAGLVFAWLILGESPSGGQWIGDVVIMAGVILNLIGGRLSRCRQVSSDENVSGTVFRGI
jgi:drug/metabolite transporter (DMT)-like permease